MKYSYNKQTNTVYITLSDEVKEEENKYSHEVWPVELKDEIGIVFDRAGQLMGMEIQEASSYFDKKRLSEMEQE